MLTKTDFMLYLEAPMHLWAAKHDQLEQTTPSKYDLHLMGQGQQIEKLARDFLVQEIMSIDRNLVLEFQRTFTDGRFEARMDAVVYDPTHQVYDLYEVKSSSSVHKEHVYDAGFQRLVAEVEVPVRHVNIVHVNKEYLRQGEVDVRSLFAITNVDEKVEELREEIAAGREDAWRVTTSPSPDGIMACLKPNACPCPATCHPGLPDHPIYDLPRLYGRKAQELRQQGVVSIADIPDAYPLSEKQQLHARVVKTGKPFIDLQAVKDSLAELVYPLNFLDYETFNPAVPTYDGYKPYQHMVFQYSLHVFDAPGSEARHYEFLATQPGDPGRQLVEHLLADLPATGSVIVWNQAFEASRNREMAELYPEYRQQLLGINDRIYDLMEIFSKGYYVHPDFHGSASIKYVLPVLVKDLSYEGMPIPKGDEAMMAWVELMAGKMSEDEAAATVENLLRYCELDTLAMVKNWEVLAQLVA